MITYKRRKRLSDDAIPEKTIEALPDELVIDILTRLPGKPVARCKRVCKPWLSVIRSRDFREVYRSRNSGVLLYSTSTVDAYRRLFFHCPLRRNDEPPAEFSPVGELDMKKNRSYRRVTELVNGLIISFTYAKKDWSNINWLTLHNVCTGEEMRIPKPVRYAATISRYNLGYDRSDRVYKLLRLTFCNRWDVYSDRCAIQRAEIMTLAPPSAPPSTWRELAIASVDHEIKSNGVDEVKSCGDDGLRCWITLKSLLVFDFNKERFHCVDFPDDYNNDDQIQNWCHAVTRIEDKLALWLSSKEDDEDAIYCYVQEDDEGKKWRISKQFEPQSERFKLAKGMFKHGEMLLVHLDDHEGGVHSFSPKDEEESDAFCIGNIRDYLVNPRLHCFAEANNLYLPLDDVLNGA